MKTSAPEKRILTIPNLLSVFRLLLIPAIVWAYCVEKNDTLAAVLLILSGLTDLADGFIARRFRMISDLGKALDPVADKLTQIAVLVCLVTQHPMMLIPLILLVVKEIAAAVQGLLVIHRTGEVHGADWHGKVSTTLLYAMMTVHILWNHIPAWLSNASIGLCTVMILYSCILYTMKNIRLMQKHERKN